ncbi:outer membrane protein [Parasphingorhabdus cellanae]|uniref:Porin family protein n=1 Tax=Parasphingorhabdus cellanae TaxID=2806553 RepID=A0ABX7T2G5_9SPHN|nr:outer membrane beta-barrel protein [Parasphingorhabdus cellanae]QTD55744.1 porin family protein [Parasphingorhabdus cellanae]
MKKTLLISTIAAFGVLSGASAAHAQNDDENFEGVKFGVQAGWERRKIDDTLLPAPNSARLNDKTSGISYGGFAGYDAQFDEFVLGVEADFSPNGKTLSSTLAGGGSIELDSKWAASVSARAGIAIVPKLLAYGRVGYGVNRYTVRRFAAGNDTAVATDKETGKGMLYGGGLEYAINRNASFRVEYRHNDNKGSLASNQVLGGLTLRF